VAASTAGKHVLIVDDDRAVPALIEQWLTGAGYSAAVRDRFNASTAIEVLK
jgi:CheY-like chemotaxis protein